MENSSSSHTVQATPESPTTVIAPDSAPTEIPDSVERPDTQADRVLEEIGSPTPVKVKVVSRFNDSNVR